MAMVKVAKTGIYNGKFLKVGQSFQDCAEDHADGAGKTGKKPTAKPTLKPSGTKE